MPATSARFRLAGGRTLDPLLFVTDLRRLRRAVGGFAEECLEEIRARGHRVVDLKGEHRPEHAVRVVRRHVRTPGLAGVVLLGGPVVVPLRIRDTIPASLRKQVAGTADDVDQFYVWSDEAYADHDGDALPELPVSRVLDGGSARFLRTQLSAGKADAGIARAGYRNIHRPFAAGVYAKIRGTRPMVVSAHATPQTVGTDRVRGDAIYIMMHGSPFDGSHFWGETRAGKALLALGASNVGPLPGALVFAGCCWGAMAWTPMAVKALGGVPVAPRTSRNSFALRCLSRGARAFIGPTGANYSPELPPYNSGAAPLHQAFWKHIAKGKAPAVALFNAKHDYAAWMGTVSQTPETLAVCYKTLRQYGCLGLGW